MTRTSYRRALSFLLAAMCACGGTQSEDTAQDPDYQLVWEDDFEGPAGQMPDEANWNFDIGGHGWGNNQLEHNTARPENAGIDGQGNLVITAREESYQGNTYTSARIQSMGKVAYRYGRIEARINLPEGQGIWPAFWLLGSNFLSAGWPDCGEIDIMEYRGQDPAVLHGTVHGPGYSGGNGIGDSTSVSGGMAGNWHTYAIEWEPGEIRWLVNDFEYHRLTPADIPSGAPWVFDQPFFIILNVAIGGWFAGNPDASTVFPQQMLVDYVRVYQDTTE